MTIPNDPLGAFMAETHVTMAGAATGPLAGKTFAAKDVFDIAGARTSFGHPDWLRTHEPALLTAPAVQRLINAGASLAGKTVSDELCYSLSGMNHHYGTPKNTAAPGRTCGGSSSGSASAVAGGLVDFALGTDCGGSVRIPASYSGLFGIRPTHERISLNGVAPFTKAFDVVGWFTRDAGLFATVGEVLLDPASESPSEPKRLLIARDAFDLVDPAVRDVTRAAADRAAGHFADVAEIDIADVPLAEWVKVFQTIQAGEIWTHLGSWIETNRPHFGPGVGDRFARAATVSADEVAAARTMQVAIMNRVLDFAGSDAVICLPSSPRIAPRLDTTSETLETTYRQQAMSLLCIAGLSGTPQVSLPLCTLEDCPLGLSFIGARNGDEQLLALAKRLAAQTGSKVSATPLMQ